MSDGATSPVLPGDLVAGKYRVERVLGTGAMGVVVAAHHIQLNQPVALKFLLPELLAAHPGVGERFLREAQTVFQLQSQHLARVFDVGVEQLGGIDVPYLVMEFLEGSDLHRIAARGPMPIEDAVSYVLQACDALAEAHALGIVHRDIKPENLFLARRTQRAPIIKVLDFGIAFAMASGGDGGERRLTQAAEVMGTPPYMSPEQIASARDADSRSDIWSLGVVLYELLTGELPFAGRSPRALCTAIMSASPAAMTDKRPQIDPELEAVVLRCLEKEPAQRFASAAELGAALAPFARSEPLSTTFGSGAHPALGFGATPVAITGLESLASEAPSDSARPARATLGPASTTLPALPRQSLAMPALMIAVVLGCLVAGVAWFVRSPAPQPAVQGRAEAGQPSEAPAAVNQASATPAMTSATATEPSQAERSGAASSEPSQGATQATTRQGGPRSAAPSAPDRPLPRGSASSVARPPRPPAPPPPPSLAIDRKG